MDARLTATNGRVAHVSLKGRVAAERFVEGEPASVVVPVTDLCSAPGGARARQLLWGEGFLVLEWRTEEAPTRASGQRHPPSRRAPAVSPEPPGAATVGQTFGASGQDEPVAGAAGAPAPGGHAGRAFGVSMRDGHVGWIEAQALGPAVEPTHRVAAPATHLYPAPDMKRREVAGLSLGALLRIETVESVWAHVEGGLWVPRRHLRALGTPARDPVAVAEALIGTPYLWGGNSRWGIDCSGLVQAGMVACDLPCPPDSDLQMVLGQDVPEGAPLRRGDLVFWKGHVGWMADGATLLHANAHHMAVAAEPLAEAAARILRSGGGEVIARRRP